MSIGENIRAVRQQKGLSQKKLGELCGIAEPTIRRYEAGTLNPKLGTIEKIASALGVSSFSLIGTMYPGKKYPRFANGNKEFEGFIDYLNSIGYIINDNYLPSQQSLNEKIEVENNEGASIELIKDGKSYVMDYSEFTALLGDTKGIIELRLWQKLHVH
ncbi:MAG: helix-turn-helix domain-containing protein [Lachnospiraceae bacterium]|nr:helix-turn-helix domain-containing protein [Lachnospiraceae bacterium]